MGCWPLSPEYGTGNFLFRSDDCHEESQTEGTYLFLYKPNLDNHQTFVKSWYFMFLKGKNQPSTVYLNITVQVLLTYWVKLDKIGYSVLADLKKRM